MGVQMPTPEETGVENLGSDAAVSGEEMGPQVPEPAAERRRFRRYQMSMPIWLSYGRNYREVDSGHVQDFSKAGLFLITEGGKDLNEGDVIKVNATFTVRGEARVVRMEDRADGYRGIALEFERQLELDI